jgi:DNA end-binding protein Ku
MNRKQVAGIGTIAIREKEVLVALFPIPGTNQVLICQTLTYPEQVRDYTELDKVKVAISPREAELMDSLIDKYGEVDITALKNGYNEALAQLLEAKASGKTLTALPEPSAPTPLDYEALLAEAIR